MAVAVVVAFIVTAGIPAVAAAVGVDLVVPAAVDLVISCYFLLFSLLPFKVVVLLVLFLLFLLLLWFKRRWEGMSKGSRWVRYFNSLALQYPKRLLEISIVVG